jgi:hypothetical protein
VAPARSKGPDGGGGDAAAGTPGKVSHSPGQLPADTGAPVPREGLDDDARSDAAIRQLADDLRRAVTAYEMNAPRLCHPGCECSISTALCAARVLITNVECYLPKRS